MEILKNNNCIIIMATIFMASSLPIPNLKDENLPWAHPCTPNRQPTELEENAELPDFNIAYLIEKVGTTQLLVDYLLETLEEKLEDSDVTRSLSKTPVSGFPEVNQTDEQQGVSMYLNHFSQLSKAAVFFEQMKHDGNDEELQSGLEDLFMENLRQMCEIHLALASQSTQLPSPAPRSIMPTELRNLENSSDQYERNYQIIYQYKLLLKSHLAQYQQIGQ